MAISSGELRERYLPALGALFPRARGASVEFFLATREHAATFRAAPGVGALRPQARKQRCRDSCSPARGPRRAGRPRSREPC